MKSKCRASLASRIVGCGGIPGFGAVQGWQGGLEWALDRPIPESTSELASELTSGAVIDRSSVF